MISLLPQNRGVSRGFTKPPARVVRQSAPADEGLMERNRAGLRTLLTRVFNTTDNAGMALELAGQLQTAVLPIFLHHPLFDRKAHAYSLPRTNMNRNTEDTYVASLFEQNPVLYDLLEALSVVPLTATRCSGAIFALLCHWIGKIYVQRVRKGPLEIDPKARVLFRYLCQTQCLPPPMDRFEGLIPFATAAEFCQVLLSCWSFCQAFPPVDSEYSESCDKRVFSKEAMEKASSLLVPFRVCIADHIDSAASIAKYFSI